MSKNKSQRKKPLMLSNLGELALLDRLRSVYKLNDSNLIAGWDDDTAILPVTGAKNRFLLMTGDMLVDGIHFKSDAISLEKLGQKAVGVNLSDIAAMAGLPVSFTVSLGAPADFRVEALEKLYKGMRKSAKKFGVELCGGDIVRAPVLTISIAMLGEFSGPVAKIPLRSKARIGDRIYLTGTIGDSAAGLKILLAEDSALKAISERDRKYLIDRHCVPQPRVSEARAVLKNVKRFSAIDLSDDLKISLDHLAKASGVGYELELEKLPLSKALLNFHGKDFLAAAKTALFGGEDFELLFTCRKKPDEIKAAFKKSGIKTRVTAIGRVTKNKCLIRWQGKPQKFSAESFVHF